ncbi:UNVERIFIED_CONTAM: hypothetical protein FKN15_052965 [Acipenser sinensis]
MSESEKVETGEDELSSPPEESIEAGEKELSKTPSPNPDSDALSPPLITMHNDPVKGRRRVGDFKPKNTGQAAASAVLSPTGTTPTPGKKTTLLSNEVRKEMAKQAKATKDERRAQLDSRHKYLISKLADGIGLGETEVEDSIVSDDKFNMIEEFFAPNGTKKLLFFYQEVSQNWGAVKDGLKNVQIQEFLSSVDKFVSSLSSARQNMEGRFELQTVDMGYNLDNLQNPSDYMIAAGNSEMVEKLEGVLLLWAKQIEQVLTESEQIRKEADDIGPSAELEHWKKRMTIFNSLLDEIKSSHVKRVVGTLQVAKSRVLKHWKKLNGNITDAANEAKDNVKYLYTLEKFFGPLGKCSPANMVEHIPSLINGIRMIHSISQYYNTSERMTSLFVKITNQMISTCRAYLCQGVSKIWDHDRNELLKKIKECINLNKEYQQCFHHVREKLRENPSDKQFEFSENYIFGKFDTFCKRLEKLADVINTIENLSDLQNVKIEGVEKIYLRFQTIVTNTKSKTYDVLDHRKQEFDNDYTEFRYQINGLYQALQTFVDSWFEQPLSTERMLDLLAKFEQIAGEQLDMTDKYLVVLQRYGKDLDLVRKLYQKQKDNPPTPRNIPPVPEMKKIIRNYNKMAAVLLEFELLYHRGWCRAAELGRQGLSASLLVRHPESKELYVNFDPVVLEVLYEAKYLYKMGYEVPEVVLNMCSNEDKIKEQQINPQRALLSVACIPTTVIRTTGYQHRLQEMLQDYESAVNKIPAMIKPLMQQFVGRVEEALSPGLTMLSWTSLNIERFIGNVYSTLTELEQTVKEASDTLDCRIEHILLAMSSTPLVDLPEEEPTDVYTFYEMTQSVVTLAADTLFITLTELEQTVKEASDTLDCRIEHILLAMSSTPLVDLPEEEPTDVYTFYEMTQSVVTLAADTLFIQSQQVERSMHELIEDLKNKMKTAEKVNLQDSYQCLHPDTKQKTRCQECLPCCFYNMMGQVCQKNTDALVKSTKLSVDALKRRLHVVSSKYQAAVQPIKTSNQAPLFKAAIQLAIPNVVMRPSLDEIQAVLNKTVNTILSMAKDIPLWNFSHLHHKQLQTEQNSARDAGDDGKMTKQVVLKPLDKQLSEHKDIIKVVVQLSSIISSLKADAIDVLENFSSFSNLWTQDPDDQVKEFLETNPLLSEFNAQITSYTKLEDQISELPSVCTVGSVQCDIEPLKLALTQECRNWKRAFGTALNKKSSTDMDEIISFIDGLSKRLNRPIVDLDDVRGAMAALKEYRDAEIRIDMIIGPIEESYALLNKHDLLFHDGNTEKVDGLAYAWKNLNTQVLQTQNFLVKVQPEMKSDLLAGVQTFQTNVQVLYSDYDERGPGVEGISPQEASDRLQTFQAHFDELWSKYITYSGGEELFGLSVKGVKPRSRILCGDERFRGTLEEEPFV